MQKPKLLAWCDFIAPTGFGNVAKNLFENLHEKYDVSIVGINYHGKTRYDTSKYFVYPVSREDMLGVKTLFSIAKEEEPDLIFLFQDIFHISDIINKLKDCSPKSKIVSYFPIDGYPFSLGWKNVLDLSDAVITYTDWAIKIIKYTVPSFNRPIHKLYHGVNTKVFKPAAKEEIKEFRRQAEWTNKFVVSNINRFQPRKAIPLTLRAFSMFSKGYKTCPECGNKMPINAPICDLNGCTEDLEVKLNLRNDTYLYLHMMPKEYSMGGNRTNLLQNHVINAGFTDQDYRKIIGINAKNIYAGEVPEEELNMIYNASNLNISSTIGEGCGLSLLEAQACGTPSLAPKNSAIPEMIGTTGEMVKNNAVFSHPMDNGHIRPHVDPFAMSQALEYYYNKWKESGEDKVVDQKCLENIKTNFLWDDKREKLEKIFEETLKGGN